MLFPGTLDRLRVGAVVSMDISQDEGRCCCFHGH